MSKVLLSPAAKADLLEISEYITDELSSPQAAIQLLQAITKKMHTLELFPMSGPPLSSVCGFDTAYRYLVCGNHLVFYCLEDTNVLVVRVLYGKRDYLRILFDEIPDSNN